ncbi:MAG: BrnA antitoxin family protein [Rhodospirillaceae bacterium]
MAKRRKKPPAYGVPDEDIPEMTLADFRRAKPVKDVMPELIAAAKRMRGRPRSADPKKHISLRLDAKVIAGFKAQGPGWQGRINDVLVRSLERSEKRKHR